MLGVKRGQVNESRGVGGGSRGLLVKNRLSDNVVPVKYFLGVLASFRSWIPTPPILCLRFPVSLAVAAQDSRPSGSLLLSR